MSKIESHLVILCVSLAACTDPGDGFGTSGGDEFVLGDGAPLESSGDAGGLESGGGSGEMGETDVGSSDSGGDETGGTEDTSTSEGEDALPLFDEKVRVAQWDVGLTASASQEDVQRVAKLIALVEPDIMLVNGIDDSHMELLAHLLGIEGGGDLQAFPLFTHMFAPTCNQGIDEPGEQPCMMLLSSYEIVPNETLTFQHFSWCDIPGDIPPPSLAPQPCDASDPSTRLFSTTFADVTIRFDFDPQTLLHVLMTHATEPTLDDELARKRNNDEIRFIKDYIDDLLGGEALPPPALLDAIQALVPVPTSIPYGYFCDDLMQNACAPLGPRRFVVLGNLNADDDLAGGVWDDGVNKPAILGLLDMPRVLDYDAPQSEGAGAEKPDATFLHPEGLRRVDYVLPSVDFVVTNSGVLWPTPEEPGFAYMESMTTLHRLTWVDMQFAP